MIKMRLSKRLKAITEFVDKEDRIIDIGCDHALLDIYIKENIKNRKIVASDIHEGAIKQAKKNIEKYSMERKISLRLGDGLDVIKEGEVDTIIIAGMGYNNIEKILSNSEKLKDINKIIVQSNTDVVKLRKSVIKLGFKITREKLVLDKDIIYTIIEFKRGVEKYNYNQIYFGPRLMENKDELFNYRIDRITNISILKEKMRRPIIDIKGLKAGFDLSKYMSEHLYMFSGEIAPVTFCVEKIYVDDVIDWFGKDIQLFNENKSEVTVRVRTNLYAMKIWAIQYGTHVRVLKPQKLVDWIKSDLQKTLKGYER